MIPASLIISECNAAGFDTADIEDAIAELVIEGGYRKLVITMGSLRQPQYRLQLIGEETRHRGSSHCFELTMKSW